MAPGDARAAPPAPDVFPGGVRSIAFGRADGAPVVVIPGIDDALHDFAAFPWVWARWVRPLTETGRRVLIVSRPRKLPPGVGIAELADLYGATLARQVGPCDVVGISMGGMIAQHLAARRPELVRRLVLAVTAHRLDPGQHALAQELAAHVEEGRWGRFFVRSARLCFTGLSRAALVALGWLVGLVLRRPRTPAALDYAASTRACLAHDGRPVLGRIRAPTLVWGAAGDLLFPPAALEETAAALPDARLELVPGAHAAFLQRPRAFVVAVRAFLDAPAEAAEPARAPAGLAPTGTEGRTA